MDRQAVRACICNVFIHNFGPSWFYMEYVHEFLWYVFLFLHYDVFTGKKRETQKGQKEIFGLDVVCYFTDRRRLFFE